MLTQSVQGCKILDYTREDARAKDVLRSPGTGYPGKERENGDIYGASSSSAASLSLAAISGGARVRAREGQGENDRLMNDLAGYYCDSLGRHACPPMVKRDMEYYLRQGMEAGVIACALDAASVADRPSWAYAMGVLRRCLSEGVKTIEAFDDRTMAHQERGRWDYENGRR